MEKEFVVVSVEFSVLLSERRVSVGCNARLPEHGTRMLDPVVRLTASCGEETVAGWGWTSVSSKEQARELLGMKVSALISPNKGVSAQGACVEAALWDLLGNILKVPVFRLLGATASFASVYFTHLYFSDLHLHSDEEACKLVAEEARAGLEQGHVAFKMKG
jgi:L-alanine-DL-glutamate epimerase-like enolase superfamily enzyme